MRGYKSLPKKSRRANKPTPAPARVMKCPHIITVAINEEGHAGVYCVDCGEQIEKEC